MSVKEFRYDIGAEILEIMEDNNDLPLPNKSRVAKVMMEYFKSEGYVDILKENNYKWRPDESYWEHHIPDITTLLRKNGKSFDFLRNDDFRGQWKFLDKKEENEILKREHSDIGTRTDTHNNKLDDTKWKHNLPHLAEVPLLN